MLHDKFTNLDLINSKYVYSDHNLHLPGVFTVCMEKFEALSYPFSEQLRVLRVNALCLDWA